jgi:putative chitobiose transport system permease protein
MTKTQLQAVAQNVLLYALMLALAAVFLGPFLWLLSSSLKPRGANLFIFPPQLIPKPATLANYAAALGQFPLLRYAKNSALIAGSMVALRVSLSCLAGYPLARIPFPGRNVILLVILSTIIIPFHSIMIYLFIVCQRLGLNNNYLGAILPFAVDAFNILIMRQAFLGIPVDLEDAARVDGASEWQIFFKVMLPLVKPALGTIALFTFVQGWNSFFWPFLILRSQELWTIQQGLASLSTFFGLDYPLITSVNVLAMIPILVLFVFLQRYFLTGALRGAVKG